MTGNTGRAVGGPQNRCWSLLWSKLGGLFLVHNSASAGASAGTLTLPVCKVTGGQPINTSPRQAVSCETDTELAKQRPMPGIVTSLCDSDKLNSLSD